MLKIKFHHLIHSFSPFDCINTQHPQEMQLSCSHKALSGMNYLLQAQPGEWYITSCPPDIFFLNQL